jgi:hypothetical protein
MSAAEPARASPRSTSSSSAATTTSQQPTGRSPPCVAVKLAWCLSGGQAVPGAVATLITSDASVVPVDDALFADLPGQSWRLK